MRWGVERRLEFIEFRLYWEGRINRADIMEQFGVSEPQASKDLSLYEEAAPGNLVYDKRGKRYCASGRFRPVFLRPDADLLLTQLKTVADRTLLPRETWLSKMPHLASVPVPHKRIDVEVLRSILEVVRRRRAVQVLYQSLAAARAKPMWRWISPHAFGNDGLRWHVRAYCHIDRKFKDFVLPRCLDARGDDQPGAQPEQDIHWNEFFDVVLIPNPGLTEEQQKAVAEEYGMNEGRITIPIRKALLRYFNAWLRTHLVNALDVDHAAPVIVANLPAFEAALGEAAR